jgi:AcrR family transcriptional regulator
MAAMTRARAGNVVTLHARKQDVVRGAIWDAAIDLFADTGFEQTTIEDIARAAGVSTRTFFRYFASKNDLMGQGMATYRALLSDAIERAPRSFSALEVVRHTVQEVAAAAAMQPRTRQIVQIAGSSVAAREAQLSRRAEVEDGVTDAFATRCRRSPRDEMTPRLLTGLTLTILDVTFRAWAKEEKSNIVVIAEEIFEALTTLVAPSARAARKAQPSHRS